MHKQTIAWLRTASARAGVVPQTGSAPRATDSPLCRTGRCRATAAGCRRGKLRAQISAHGWVAEWLKAPVLKTGEAATSPWVRIPPHPPTGDTAPRGWFTRQALRQTPGALPLDQHEIIAREVGLEHALQRDGIVGVELDQRTASGVGRCRLHGGEVGKAEGRDVEDIPRARAGRKVGDDVVFASVAEQVGVVAAVADDLLPYLYPFRVLRCSRFCPPGTGLHTRPVRAHSSSNAAGVHCSRPSMR